MESVFLRAVAEKKEKTSHLWQEYMCVLFDLGCFRL